jgi:hypothetical protein
MSAFAGPFAIATCLLALAGFAKAMQPAATAGALAALGLPHRRWLVRAGGSAEALVAFAALVTGDATLAILVAMSYAGFALFVAAALYRGTPLSSCGCFGKIDTPPSPMHVALDLLAAGAAIGFVADGGAPIRDVLAMSTDGRSAVRAARRDRRRGGRSHDDGAAAHAGSGTRTEFVSAGNGAQPDGRRRRAGSASDPRSCDLGLAGPAYELVPRVSFESARGSSSVRP